MRTVWLAAALVFALGNSQHAQALVVDFVFDSDGAAIFSGSPVPGTVTGRISGLADNTADQLAGITLELLTFPAPLGGSASVVSNWDIFDGGFAVAGGELTDARLIAQQTDASTGLFAQLRLNFPTTNLGNVNWLTFDSGARYTGNIGGLSGVSFTTVSVFEPSTGGLLLLGLLGGLLGRRLPITAL